VVDDREFPVEDDSSVSVAALSPEKTAVSEAGGTDSVDSVPAQSEGWYRLASSTLPAKKLSGVGSWSASGVCTSGDRALHEAWQVRADAEILDGDGETLFDQGDVIADADDETYFELRSSGDSFVVAATDAFFEVVTS